MIYRIYHNLSRYGRIDGYSSGDTMWIDPTVYAIADLGDDTLDAVYGRHNRDDRPDGQIAPSLSVGDVVAVTDLSPDVSTRYYAVDSIGFSSVDAPEVLSTAPDYLSAITAAEEPGS